MGTILKETRQLLASTLGLGDRADSFDESTPLLGSLPEFDSMAVVTLLAALEEHFGFIAEDDEIFAETFETLGSLVEFVSQKQGV